MQPTLSHLLGFLAAVACTKAFPAKSQDAMTVRLGKTSKQPKQSEIVCGERALKLAPWISTRLAPGAFVRRAGLSGGDGEGPNLASYL